MSKTTVVSRNEVQRVLDLSSRGEVIFEEISGGFKIYDGNPAGHVLTVLWRDDAAGFGEAHAQLIADGHNPQAAARIAAAPAAAEPAPAEQAEAPAPAKRRAKKS